ncbi:alpha/beta hydrolase [Candidatus Daviesbacteria bacterium]|nr:alpha/beta hydrolase [Candidatus Daviesbacteria bacterium]
MNLYFQKIGKGKDLILLPGWGHDVSSFWPVVDLLKNDFTLWLLDLPGFGRSEMPSQTWTVENYADEIAKFIKDQKIKKSVLLGHSFGGSVAIKLTAKYPNLISKLILEASSGIRPKPTIFNRLSFLISKIINFFPNLLNVKDRLRNWFYKMIGSDYLTTGLLKKTFQKVIRQDLSEEAKKIQQETLILWGEDDKTLSLERGKKLYQLIKNSRLEILENCGHAPHIKNPYLFTNYVKDFI